MDGFYLHAGGGLFPASATANTRGDQRQKHFGGKVQLSSSALHWKAPSSKVSFPCGSPVILRGKRFQLGCVRARGKGGYW